MPPHTILVLGNPAARHLALLDRLPGSDTRVLTGESVDVFLHAAGEADVVLLAGNYTVLLLSLIHI